MTYLYTKACVRALVLSGITEKIPMHIAARIIYDRESGRSRGFGFVTFNTSEDASAAIQALDGQVSLHSATP